MNTAYLGLGSNVDAERNIRAAVQILVRSFHDVEVSPVYRSRSVGFEGEDFVNLVVRVSTAMTPVELRQFLRELEDTHGRDRSSPKWSDRTLDVDILLYDDLSIDTEHLVLPRPEILRFAHVLKPLADIAPGLSHPVENKPLAEIWGQGDWNSAGLELMDSAFLELA